MPEGGIEPPPPRGDRILNPARLPVPPLRPGCEDDYRRPGNRGATREPLMSDTRIFTNPAAASPANFSWQSVASSLGVEGTAMNLGHLATAGAVARGFGGDHAVVWYGADGEVQRITYAEL